MNKLQHMDKIRRAMERAKEDGFRIVVASDEEGNAWNRIEPFSCFYGDTNDRHIALGVVEAIDEEDIFNKE